MISQHSETPDFYMKVDCLPPFFVCRATLTALHNCPPFRVPASPHPTLPQTIAESLAAVDPAAGGDADDEGASAGRGRRKRERTARPSTKKRERHAPAEVLAAVDAIIGPPTEALDERRSLRLRRA